MFLEQRLANARLATENASRLLKESADPQPALDAIEEALQQLDFEPTPDRKANFNLQMSISLNTRAECLGQQKNHPEALKVLNKSLPYASRASTKQYVDTLAQRGSLLLFMDQPDAAYVDFSHVRKLDPSHEAATVCIAEQQSSMGNAADAAALISLVLEDPRSLRDRAGLLQKRANYYCKANCYQEAWNDALAAFEVEKESSSNLLKNLGLLRRIAVSAGQNGQNSMAEQFFRHLICVCEEHESLDGIRLIQASTLVGYAKCKSEAGNLRHATALLDQAEAIARLIPGNRLVRDIRGMRNSLSRAGEADPELPPPDYLATQPTLRSGRFDMEWLQNDPLMDISDYTAAAKNQLSKLPSSKLPADCKSTIELVLHAFISEYDVDDEDQALDPGWNPTVIGLISLIRGHYGQNHMYKEAFLANEILVNRSITYKDKNAIVIPVLWQVYLRLQVGEITPEQAAEQSLHLLEVRADGLVSIRANLQKVLVHFIAQLIDKQGVNCAYAIAKAYLEGLDDSTLPLKEQVKLRVAFARRFAMHKHTASVQAILEPIDKRRIELPLPMQIRYIIDRSYFLCADDRHHQQIIADLQEALAIAAGGNKAENIYWAIRGCPDVFRLSEVFAALEAEAVKLHIESLTLPDVLKVLFLQGDTLAAIGMYDESEQCYYRLIESCPPIEECSSRILDWLSKAHSVLAKLAEVRNNRDTFELHMKDALRTSSTIEQEYRLLNQRCNFLVRSDLLDDALICSDEALKMLSKIGEIQQVFALNDRANIEQRLGCFDDAIALRTKVLRALNARYYKTNNSSNEYSRETEQVRQQLRRSLNMCAESYITQWQASGKTEIRLLKVARKRLDRALQLAPHDKYAQHKYFRVLKEQGDLQGALRILHRSARLLHSDGQHDDEQYGYIYSGIVTVLFELKHYKRCLRCCEKFINRSFQLSSANIASLTIQFTKAQALLALGQDNEAREEYVAWFDNAVKLVRGLPDFRLYRLLEEELWDYVLLATEGLIKLSSGDPDALSEALWHYERFLNLQTGSAPHLYDEVLERARAKFEGRQRALCNTQTPDDEGDSKWLDWVEGMKLAAVSDLEQAIRNAASKNPQYMEWLKRRFTLLSVNEVLRTVSTGTVVLIPFCGPHRTGWFVFSSQRSVTFVDWDIQPEDAQEMLKRLSDSFLGKGDFDKLPMRTDAKLPPIGHANYKKRAAWRKAFAALFLPLVRLQEGVAAVSNRNNTALSNLLILTSDSLHDVAWHALLGKDDSGGIPRLCDYFSVSETPTLRTRKERNATQVETEAPVIVSIVDPATELPRLPGTNRERELIEQYGDETSEYFSAETASIDLLEDPHTSLERANILHLACHGQVSQDSPLLAYLTLAPSDREVAKQLQIARTGRPPAKARGVPHLLLEPDGGNVDDGQFFVWKFDNLPLANTELTILSCCQLGRTGGGRRDAAYGLMRSLASAGVRTVLAHIWNADDAAAAEFIAIFVKVWVHPQYRGRIGATLREAQRLFVQVHGTRYGHEYFWAGWSAYDLT